MNEQRQLPAGAPSFDSFSASSIFDDRRIYRFDKDLCS
jgi:hypothetical protein